MANALRKDIIKDQGKSGLKKKTLDLITLLRLERSILENESKRKYQRLTRGSALAYTNSNEVEAETIRM